MSQHLARTVEDDAKAGNNSNEITRRLDAISTHEPWPPGSPGRGDRIEPLGQVAAPSCPLPPCPRLGPGELTLQRLDTVRVAA